MQPHLAFAEEIQIVLSSINAPSTSDFDDDHSVESPDDEFDHLPAILDKKTLDILEAKLGLGGGGDWWLDPSRDPIEVDSQGNRDEGAIFDVEANCRIWFRAPFDRDPEFCNDSYHLLNRLNELAKIKRLIEEASLKKQPRNHSELSDNDRQIYHSTLSVNGSVDLNNLPPTHMNRDIQNVDPLSDLRRSLNGSFKDNYLNTYGTYALRKRNNSQKTPLAEVFGVRAHESDSTSYSDKNRQNISQAVHSGLPQLHKSQQPPHSTPGSDISPIFGRRKGSMRNNQLLFVPGATSTPNQKNCSQKRSVLSRTYSKEQMDLLREVNDYQVNDSVPKVASLLSRSHALTNSLPMSDNEGDMDVTKSLDISSGVNPLSQSLSATELAMKGRKLSEKVNASCSSMRSSDVFELARLQETHLREHSGSRSKLDCSNSSLTGSSFGGEKPCKHESSGDSIGQKSGSGLSSCYVSATHSREEIIIDDPNGKPERQHTIIANEYCLDPLSVSVASEYKLNLTSNVGTSGNFDENDVSTPSKPLNSTFDAPDFKRVYEQDPTTPQVDPLKKLRPVIDPIDTVSIITNEPAAHINGQVVEDKENKNGSCDSKQCSVVTVNKSDTIPSSGYSKVTEKDDGASKFEVGMAPTVPPSLDAMSTSKFVMNFQTLPTSSDNESQPRQESGLKPPSKTSIPLPSGKISRLPMPSQNMPSMSISSRIGSRKGDLNGHAQGSTSMHSTVKTRIPSQNISSTGNEKIRSSGESSASFSTSKTQPPNPTKSFPKPLSSFSNLLQKRKPIPTTSGISSSNATVTYKKPSLPLSVTSSRRQADRKAS